MGFPDRPVVLALVCLCLGISCVTEQEPLNVVLIGVDTLRPDHLGCYGYPRSTSPNVDRLADQGVRFENVVSQAPWTLPSFATVLTSLYPTQHGAGIVGSGTSHFGTSMRTSFPPLAMTLLKAGYTTGAIINGPALSPEYGVDRGFEFYDGVKDWQARPADRVTLDALKWIDEQRDKPFFLFVHYFDPHVPYEPPPPYDEIFDPGYRGRVGLGFDRDTYAQARQELSRTDDPRAAADWNHLRALYDGEIAFTDAAVGDLIAGLEERGLRKNTLIVFLSDHGEEFFDHGGFEHGHTLYNELLRVPLVFSLPGVVPGGACVGTQVRLLDVMPTILDLAGVEPESRLEGVSLRSLMHGRKVQAAARTTIASPYVAYSEAILYGTEKKSVSSHQWKLICDTATGKSTLYNLECDPGEVNDLSASEPATARALEEVLLRMRCGLSETWFIELAGSGQMLDLILTLPTRPRPAEFEICRFLDSAGNLLESNELRFTHESMPGAVALRLEGLHLDGKITLAVKVAPETAPLGFDLRLDGRSALERTFLGQRLAVPERMPFRQDAAAREASAGEPERRPRRPYVLIWHSVPRERVDTPVRLADRTERSLRALGYIQ
jgi:arylsulfatase A-like enzyme